jgi:hypothetical protein
MRYRICPLPVRYLMCDVLAVYCVYLAPAAAPPVLVLRFGGFVRFVLFMFMFMFMCFAQQPAAQQRPAPAPSGTSGQLLGRWQEQEGHTRGTGKGLANQHQLYQLPAALATATHSARPTAALRIAPYLGALRALSHVVAVAALQGLVAVH